MRAAAQQTPQRNPRPARGVNPFECATSATAWTAASHRERAFQNRRVCHRFSAGFLLKCSLIHWLYSSRERANFISKRGWPCLAYSDNDHTPRALHAFFSPILIESRADRLVQPKYSGRFCVLGFVSSQIICTVSAGPIRSLMGDSPTISSRLTDA
jgi:hypothetical protein